MAFGPDLIVERVFKENRKSTRKEVECSVLLENLIGMWHSLTFG